MVEFKRCVLPNGLRVIHHEDRSTSMVAINVLYNVGSRNEYPDKTGFAHLFEHLMFGGSVNIPSYDDPLQNAGGENNAWTSNDMTNYYLTLPAANAEIGFWLESDRMLGLAFSKKSLNVQRQVVIEEFKQRYLNQPYGDVPLLLRPLAYKSHPYQWPTIGKDIGHIEKASLSDVEAFFYKHYSPNNAVLVVSGAISEEHSFALADKWFSSIPSRVLDKHLIPQEEKQTEARFLQVERDVPLNAIYKAWHMPARTHADYFVCDLISDILSSGSSSRLYQHLVKEAQLFVEIDAYISGDMDPGLFHVSGRMAPGVTYAMAEEAIRKEINSLITTLVSDRELMKVQNKAEANLTFGEISYLNNAMNLAFYELYFTAEDMNKELEQYRRVTKADVQRVCKILFQESNCSTLHYQMSKEEGAV